MTSYSQVVIAKELNINPATAAKGIRILVERDILEKVRGQAMTIKKGAVEMIKARKTNDTLSILMENLISEAKKLGMNKEELLNLLSENF